MDLTPVSNIQVSRLFPSIPIPLGSALGAGTSNNSSSVSFVEPMTFGASRVDISSICSAPTPFSTLISDAILIVDSVEGAVDSASAGEKGVKGTCICTSYYRVLFR